MCPFRPAKLGLISRPALAVKRPRLDVDRRPSASAMLRPFVSRIEGPVLSEVTFVGAGPSERALHRQRRDPRCPMGTRGAAREGGPPSRSDGIGGGVWSVEARSRAALSRAARGHGLLRGSRGRGFDIAGWCARPGIRIPQDPDRLGPLPEPGREPGPSGAAPDPREPHCASHPSRAGTAHVYKNICLLSRELAALASIA